METDRRKYIISVFQFGWPLNWKFYWHVCGVSVWNVANEEAVLGRGNKIMGKISTQAHLQQLQVNLCAGSYPTIDRTCGQVCSMALSPLGDLVFQLQGWTMGWSRLIPAAEAWNYGSNPGGAPLWLGAKIMILGFLCTRNMAGWDFMLYPTILPTTLHMWHDLKHDCVDNESDTIAPLPIHLAKVWEMEKMHI